MLSAVRPVCGDARKEAIGLYDHIEPRELQRANLAYIPQLGLL